MKKQGKEIKKVEHKTIDLLHKTKQLKFNRQQQQKTRRLELVHLQYNFWQRTTSSLCKTALFSSLLSEEVVKGANRGTEVIGEAEEQWLEEEQDEEEEEQEGVEVEGSGGGGGATAGRGAPIITSTNFCLSQYTPAS